MASPELNRQRTAMTVETEQTVETAETIIEPIAGTQSIFISNRSADPRLSAINRGGGRGSRVRGRKITVMSTEVYTRLRSQMNKEKKD